MDYFKQLRAFYAYTLTSSPASPEISLWHALMWQSNVLGWPTEFNIPLSTLCIYTGLSTAGVKRARNALTTRGLIEWHRQKGRQSAVYSVVALYEPQVEPQSVPQSEPQSVPQSEPQSEPIHKHKTKTNISTATATARVRAREAEPGDDPALAMVVTCYEENIGTLSRAVWDSIREWLEKLPPDLICEAIGEAALINKRTWKYVLAILRRCEQQNVTSVAAYRTEKLRHASARASPHGQGGTRRETAQDAFLRMAMEGDDQGGFG